MATVDVLMTQFQASGQGQVTGAFRSIAKEAGGMDAAAMKVGGLSVSMTTLATAAGLAVGAMVAFGVASVRAAADMEMLQRRVDGAFKGMTTTLDGATVGAMEFAKAMNLRTPFDLREVVDLMVRMQALGLDAFRNLPTMLDTAAGLGNTETAMNVARQLGQMLAKNRVLMEDLSIIAENGVPVFRYLQEELGITAEQLARIGEAGLDAKSTVNAILNALDKEHFGKAAGAMDTVTGSISNLKEAWNELKVAFGESFLPSVTFAVKSLTAVLNELKEPMAFIGRAIADMPEHGGVAGWFLRMLGFGGDAKAGNSDAARAKRNTTSEVKYGDPFKDAAPFDQGLEYARREGQPNGISKLIDAAAMALGGGVSPTDSLVQQFIRGGGERLKKGVGAMELPRALSGQGAPVVRVKVDTGDNSPLGRAMKDLMEKFGVDVVTAALRDKRIQAQIGAM